MYGDKTGRKFPLKRKRIARCYFEIENCVPLNGTRKIDFPGNFFLKLDGDEREVAHFSLLAQGVDDGYRKNGQYTARTFVKQRKINMIEERTLKKLEYFEILNKISQYTTSTTAKTK